MKDLREKIKDLIYQTNASFQTDLTKEQEEWANKIVDSILTLIRQEISEAIPEEKKECGCEKSQFGYHTKDCSFYEYGWNACIAHFRVAFKKRGLLL